jgi:MFS-type transporter involved in bile tolerance (Atg22 family)
MDEYAVVLNALPVLGVRLVVTSFVALLGGYLCAKLAEGDEMRYTLIAVIFRILAIAGGNAAGYMPRTPVWALAVLLTISTGAMLAGGAVRAAAAAAGAQRRQDR